MRHCLRIVIVVSMLLPAAVVLAGDWPHFRGPAYNGAGVSPTLIDSFDKDGPKQLWESEPLSTKGGTGYGTVSMADGRAYFYVQTTYRKKVEERAVPRDLQSRLGYVKGMPEDLVAAVEKTRVSDERAKANNGRAVRDFTNKWVEANLPKEHGRYKRAVEARLNAGADAIPLEVCEKLDDLQGKTFDNQAALDAELDKLGLDDAQKKQVSQHVPTDQQTSDDTLYSLDAETGKVLWKKDLPSHFMWNSASCTPTVTGGRCYVLSSEAKVYCFDAKTGEQVWASDQVCHPGSRNNTHARSSSVLILDGVAIVTTARRTSGLDAATGKVLWKNDKITSEYGSAVPCTVGGKTVAVLVGSGKVAAFEPKTGEVVWTVKGGDGSTPTIVGNLMAITTANKSGELLLYELPEGEPKLKWSVPFGDQFTAPIIHDGHVYVVGEAYSMRGKARALCVDAATGEVKWSQVLGTPQHSSPALADGKIVAVCGDTLLLFNASPEKYVEVGKARLGLVQWSSVAVVDGKAYLHKGKTVACYDLRK